MKKVLLFTFLGCISLLHGQRLPYPFLYHVTSRCNVTYSKINELYNYNYIVINDTTNKGTITEIDLDISRGPISVNYDTLGLTFYSKLSELYFRRYYPRLVNRIVPVGFPTFPKKGWFAIVGNNPETGILTDSLGIVPGQTVNRIILTSKALPGIRNIRFVPDFWDDYYFQYDDTTNTDDIDSVRHVINYYGNTVGPTAPPINFIPTVWCGTLTNYTTQSRSLGWIKDDATENKYLSYFASAKTKLLQQDNVGARNVLLQVLKDIDIDSTANLTNEAYALICYNTKYLLAHFGFNGGR
jgi:hypothetical protein